jgi:hypothetical protein
LERRVGDGIILYLCFDLELEEEEFVLADFSGGGSGTESTIRRAWERRVVSKLRREAWSVGISSRGVEVRHWRASWRAAIKSGGR